MRHSIWYMAITQGQSLRKPSGGRNTSTNPKKLHQKASRPTLTTIGEKKRQTQTRTRGGSNKTKLLTVGTVNLYDPKKKKHVQAKLKNVVENPANENYVRRNILTKGAIVETEKGKAVITSKPGQENQINAKLITN